MNAVNTPDGIALKLLDEITREPEISQRALAAKLGIALGLVNSYVKRLYKKGHIKVKTLPRNRIKYIITPLGFAEKVRLTYDYMNYSIMYFREIRDNIERTYSRMMAEDIKRILLWGDGEIAELCYVSARGLPLKIVGLISESRSDAGFFGHNIYTPAEIEMIEYDAVLVSSIDEATISGIKEYGFADNKIFYL
jgi:DNA-binding MarR family transcriptional regulator